MHAVLMVYKPDTSSYNMPHDSMHLVRKQFRNFTYHYYIIKIALFSEKCHA